MVRSKKTLFYSSDENTVQNTLNIYIVKLFKTKTGSDWSEQSGGLISHILSSDESPFGRLLHQPVIIVQFVPNSLIHLKKTTQV